LIVGVFQQEHSVTQWIISFFLFANIKQG